MLEDCWVLPPMGGYPIRIDRGEARSTMKMLGIKKKRHAEMLGQLLILQKAATGYWSEIS